MTESDFEMRDIPEVFKMALSTPTSYKQLPLPSSEIGPTGGFSPPIGLIRPGRSPPFVLGGIQLSGPPWPGAGASSTMFGLALHGSAVSSRARRPQDFSFTAFDETGLVSVPSPTVSSYVSRRRASCSEGGTSPG